MRRLLLILVALAAIVAVEIAWMAPASLLGSRVEDASGGTLRLVNTEGTIWRARGMLVADGLRLPLAWDMDFWPLLRGEARVRLSPYAGTTTGPPRADLRLRSGGVSASAVEIVAPAQLLAAFAPPLRSWSVGGEVRIASSSFEFSPPANRGSARIAWQRAQLAPPAGGDAVDLGTITLELTADGNLVRGPVHGDGGSLAIDGTLELRGRDDVTVALSLAPVGTPPPALAGLLAALGADAANRWRVEWRTRAP